MAAAAPEIRVKWVFMALGWALWSFFATIFLTMVVYAARTGTPLPSVPLQAMLLAFVFITITTAASAFGCALLARGDLSLLGVEPVRRPFDLLLGIVIALAITRAFWPQLHRDGGTMEDGIRDASPTGFVVALVVMAAMSVTYELLVRGVALRALSLRFGLVVGVLGTTLFESATGLSMKTAPPLLLQGVLLAVISWRCQSTVAPMAVVIGTDVIEYSWLRVGGTAPAEVDYALLAAGAVCTSVLAVSIIRALRRRELSAGRWTSFEQAAATAASPPASGRSSSTTRTS